MKVSPLDVSIRDLTKEYQDLGEDGVTGYGGLLDIRPPYQREFIYKPSQRDAVIDTVSKGHPLGIFYWAVDGADDDGNETYEILDGQQRTVSISQFVNGDYSVSGIFTADGNTGPKYFTTLTDLEQQRFLDYKLLVYICDGEDTEKLAWFRTINIAGEKLTEQELRNAVYAGPWLTDAKRKFSKTNCVAALKSDGYVKANTLRQELLEKALEWKRVHKGLDSIETYMNDCYQDPNANALWNYFSKVIEWAKGTFPKKRKELTSVNWGALYEAHGDEVLDTDKLEERVSALMGDDDVTKKAGVYEYVLNGSERALSIRAFTAAMKRSAYERQGGVCPDCQETFAYSKMHADHEVAWSKGGRTIPENCVMRCGPCNRAKTDHD